MAIPSDDPDAPFLLPRSLFHDDASRSDLRHVFDYARRDENENEFRAVLTLQNKNEVDALLEFYRRIRSYIREGRNHVWEWYITNLMEPLRLSQNPPSRLVGNPPWVVYNAMSAERQDAFRQQGQARNLWAGAHLATQNDLAATFVATCVDLYLKPGGKFGFVLPYAALRARQWEPFRSGEWSLPTDIRPVPTRADLRKAAWNLKDVKAPPFPQAASSVLFGARIDASKRPAAPAVPLNNVVDVTSSQPVNVKMPWDQVKPRLTYIERPQRKTAPSKAYADAFRQGATLVPQSLVVFAETETERSRGVVYFRTRRGKGDWNGLERQGDVEERFVRQAVFSRHLLPFGVTGSLNIVAPFSENGESVLDTFPQGANVSRFNRYWSAANADYRDTKKPKSPNTLAGQIDYLGKLSARLRTFNQSAVVYSRSGSWLSSAVVPPGAVIDSTLFWFSTAQLEELHYLSAIFNAPSLADFFHHEGRASDRDFHTGPVRSLPIPKFNPRDHRHASLAAQSQLAHKRVASLLTQRQTKTRSINRNDVLNDPAMRTILASVSQSVRAILPDYCS